MSSIPHARPEECLAQVGWMRSLARSLLADPSAADDVVQEAWAAALEHPPLADRPLEPWLARVVRNFAWKRRRGERRRAEHERVASPPEPAPSPAATAERLELQRTVLAAVEAVPEPLRTVVVQRYLEGRSGAEIARALGVPEGTVRWRLKRGLEELRGRLDQRYGERDAWCALLAPLASAPAPVLPLAPSAPGPALPFSLEPGVLAMLAASKVALVALVSAAALGFVLLTRGEGARGGQPTAELAAAAPAAQQASVEPLEAPSAERSETREERERTPTKGTEPPSTEVVRTSAARPTQGMLLMRFVDRQGAPWSGVRVQSGWDEEKARTSGSDGRVELVVEPGGDVTEWSVALEARRAGCASRFLHVTAVLGRATHLGDIVLEPGSRLEGRVLDDVGVALAGAEVGLAAPELFGQDDHRAQEEGLARRQGTEAFRREGTTESDASGAFDLEGVPLGRHRLWAHAPGMRYAWSEPFEVRAGEDLFGLELRLTPLLATDRITGIVLDPEGEPLGGAHLLYSYEREHESGSTSTNVGPDGRFDLVLRWECEYALVASDTKGRYAEAHAAQVAPGTRELELRLGEKRVFEADVRDAEGRPIEECRFTLSMDLGGAINTTNGSPERLEPGLYALVQPTLPFTLEVEADGFLPATLEGLRPAALAARLEVVLARAPRVAGRVVADGQSVGGARVTLHGAVLSHSYRRNGFHCLYSPDVLDETTSDVDGRFVLTCRDEKAVWVRATSAGWVAGDLGPFAPDAGGDVRLELTSGGSLEGRVLLPDGAEGVGVVVGISRGDGHPRTLRAGPEGRFRFDHLMPGRWQVQRCEKELDPSYTTVMSGSEEVEIEWDCTVEPGRVTHFDLDLSTR